MTLSGRPLDTDSRKGLASYQEGGGQKDQQSDLRNGRIVFWAKNLVLLECVIILSAMACSKPISQRYFLTERDDGRILSLKPGDIIEMNFPNPSRGGYNVVNIIYDSSVLEILSKREQPQEPSPVPKLGDFGRIIYEFKVVGLGQSDLAIQIGRDWEVNSQARDLVRVKTVVAK
jgi:predicted secreted protein